MRPFRIALVAALSAALVFGTFGCTDKNVAAKVNGEVITVDELNKQVEQLKAQYPDMFEGSDGEGRLIDFKQRILDNLIDQMLLTQDAEARDIKIGDEQIKTQVDQLRAGFESEEQFASALKSAGMTEESLNTQVREQLLTQKIMESLETAEAASEAEIKKYYEANEAQFFQQAAKRASHILFKPEDKATAQKVLDQIEAGGDFAALAKEYSQDPGSAANGGDLGWPSTAYVTEFEEALSKLKKGETSALVQSPYGWHIIRVTDERKGSQQTLDQVKDQIASILSQQTRADAYQKHLEELRAKAKIEILIEELKASVDGSAETTSTTE